MLLAASPTVGAAALQRNATSSYSSGGCLPCAPGGTCTRGSRTSVYSAAGECVFDGSVQHRTAFATGYLMNFGACYVVSRRISETCFAHMPLYVARQLRAASPLLTAAGNATMMASQCVSNIVDGPCLLGELKYAAHTRTMLATCADIHRLFQDAMEHCLRKEPDARVWATWAYAAVLWSLVAPCLAFVLSALRA
jgi:hypothetical protein